MRAICIPVICIPDKLFENTCISKLLALLTRILSHWINNIWKRVLDTVLQGLCSPILTLGYAKNVYALRPKSCIPRQLFDYICISESRTRAGKSSSIYITICAIGTQVMVENGKSLTKIISEVNVNHLWLLRLNQRIKKTSMEIGWGNWNKGKKVCKDGNVCRGRKCVFGDRKYKELGSIKLPEQKVNIWDEKEFIETHTHKTLLCFIYCIYIFISNVDFLLPGV